MSADFWAGYVSGAVGILIGNPLDLLKVRLQASSPSASNQTPASYASQIRSSPSSLITGTAAPVLGYGALNALLFVSYNRSEAILNRALAVPAGSTNLWSTWVAGAIGGLATWVVSTPTELVKCRAQLATGPGQGSWTVAKQVWRAEGLRGFYFGGTVTAIRDSVGYGFYFWAYELSTRWMSSVSRPSTIDNGTQGSNLSMEAAKVLLCGGLAGVVTWVSIFPLDVIKTRVQTQAFGPPPSSPGERASLLADRQPEKRLGAIQVAKETYREGGVRVFFRGLAVCSVRAFIVNAVQWAVYEWIMTELGQGRRRQAVIEPSS